MGGDHTHLAQMPHRSLPSSCSCATDAECTHQVSPCKALLHQAQMPHYPLPFFPAPRRETLCLVFGMLAIHIAVFGEAL